MRGYGTVHVPAVIEATGFDTPTNASLTATLGCEEFVVDGYHFPEKNSAPLSPAHEQLIIPFDTGAGLAIGDVPIAESGIGFVPAGIHTRVQTDAGGTFVVIAAPGGGPAEITSIDLDTCEFEIPATSAVATAWLTSKIGCHTMKVNARRLEVGEHVPYHTEGEQEELFVPVRGPASMRIAGEEIDTPVGSLTRVTPSIPRSAVNPGNENALWVMIGAPPTGGPTDWDPGATILEE